MDSKDREAGLVHRRQALQAKRQQDQNRLEEHRKILDALFRGDEQSRVIREQALGQIEKWERNQLCNPRYVHKWREWLAQPASFARAAILREDDLGVSMRQNSPFSHAIAMVK